MAACSRSARMPHVVLHLVLVLLLLLTLAAHVTSSSSDTSSPSSKNGRSSSSSRADAAATEADDTTRQLIAAGDHLLGQGRAHYESALGKYTEALMREPRSERALFSRAELLVLLHRPQRALSDLNVLLDHVNSASLGARQLRLQLNAQTAGQLAPAATDAEALVRLLQRQGAPAAKVQAMQRTAATLRRYAAEWHALRDILHTEESSDESGTDEHRATGAASGGSSAALLLHRPAANNETAKARYASCVRLLNGVIAEFGKDAVSLRLRRASCALALRRNNDAAVDIRFVLRKEPHNLRAMALNAHALRELGALDQALSELRRCLALDPEYAACAQLHKRVRAHKRLVSEIEAKMSRRAFGEAIAAIHKGLAAEAEAPYTDQLGEWLCEAYVGERDTEKGLQACTAVLERLGSQNPAACPIHLHMAEIHVLEGNLDAATQAVQEAQSLNRQHPKLAEMQQKVENLKRQGGSRKDYYKILGVKKTASAAEVRRAYRKLAKQHHPDQLRSRNMTEKERSRQDQLFRDMNEAKEVLLDADKRARYDNGEDVTKPPGQQEYAHPEGMFNFEFPGRNMGNFQFRPGGGHGRGGGGPGPGPNFFFFQRN